MWLTVLDKRKEKAVTPKQIDTELKVAEVKKRFPVSYDFLNQLASDLSHVEEHPLLAPAAQAKLKQARLTVSELCYEIHGKIPS